jgi:formylmethanofuran dehydrogenase subunit E
VEGTLVNNDPNRATDRQTASDEVTCQLCQRDVPARRATVIGGRTLCFDCASGWFDEDDEESET